MTREELESLIAEVQHRQCELNDVEVKSARGGTPKRLYEALSAFANRTGGGVILLGLDENADFGVAGVGNAHQLQADIGDLASNEMEPALRPEFTVEEIGGKTVVAAEVASIPRLPAAEPGRCLDRRPRAAGARSGRARRTTKRPPVDLLHADCAARTAQPAATSRARRANPSLCTGEGVDKQLGMPGIAGNRRQASMVSAEEVGGQWASLPCREG